MNCDLCHERARIPKKSLCKDCGEAITRLNWIALHFPATRAFQRAEPEKPKEAHTEQRISISDIHYLDVDKALKELFASQQREKLRDKRY